MECIKRRLLHIAEQTYYNPLAATGRFSTIGWEGDAQLVRREPDVAVVGRIDSGVVVAFRGTRAPLNPRDDDAWATFLDWMNNTHYLTHENPNYPGSVHSGFAGSVDRLWGMRGTSPGIEKAVETLFAAGAPRRLYFTGHSKGGPLANLGAWRATRKWPDIKPRVVTFAAARAGDAAFRTAYQNAGIDCTRYEVTSDIVPLLPLGTDTPGFVRDLLAALPFVESNDLGYVPVGTAVAGGLPLWRSALNNIGGLFRGGGFRAFMPAFVTAHLITPDSGYDKLVCPRGEAGCAHR
jgi:hypothetical protein